jgi:hypothetical protein
MKVQKPETEMKASNEEKSDNWRFIQKMVVDLWIYL